MSGPVLPRLPENSGARPCSQVSNYGRGCPLCWIDIMLLLSCPVLSLVTQLSLDERQVCISLQTRVVRRSCAANRQSRKEWQLNRLRHLLVRSYFSCFHSGVNCKLGKAWGEQGNWDEIENKSKCQWFSSFSNWRLLSRYLAHSQSTDVIRNVNIIKNF